MTGTPANDNRAVHILTYIEIDDGTTVVIVFDGAGGIVSENQFKHHVDAHKALVDLAPCYPHATIDDRAGAMQIPGGAA